MGRIIVLLLYMLVSHQLSLAQCECPPLPQNVFPSDTVSTVGELQAALSTANSSNGQRNIILMPGTYVLSSNLLFISANMSDLTIRGITGNAEDVILKGQGWNDNSVTHIFNVAADRFTLADMTIGHVYYHPVQIHSNNNGFNDADDCLIQNVRFEDAKEQLLKVSAGGDLYSDRGIVQCCVFEFTAGIAYQYYTGGIDAHRSVDWIVRNNTFIGIRSPEANLAEHAIHFWRESSGTLVENNTIINCDRGIGFGLGGSAVDGHTGGLVRNNFVHASRDVGIGLEGSPNTKVYHNTVITGDYPRSIEYRFATTSGVHIANNITDRSISDRSSGSSGTVESNVQINDLQIFADAASYDYHLSGPTDGITNAGINLSDVSSDFDCEDRSDDLPDIGADELLSTPDVDVFLESQAIELWPNPVTSTFTIGGLISGYTIEILDQSGNVYDTIDEVTETITIDISDLPSGLYFVRITHSDQQYSEVLSVQLILKT